MKHIITLFFVLIFNYLFCGNCFSSSFQVFDADTAKFPEMNAKYYAYDTNFHRIENLSASDFKVFENGVERQVLNISCPTQQSPQSLSIVLAFDVSVMMSNKISLAKAASQSFLNTLDMSNSECAITTFNSMNNLILDFTNDKNLLIERINNLKCLEYPINYNTALIDQPVGAVPIAKTGHYKRIIIMISGELTTNPPDTTSILNEAKSNNISIYYLTLGIHATGYMKNLSEQTGGQCFDNILTFEQAVNVYLRILNYAQGISPCSISWNSEMQCQSDFTNVDIKLINYNLSSSISYPIPFRAIRKLVFNPTTMRINKLTPGVQRDTTITVTAVNADFDIKNITNDNILFSISPQGFVLHSGESRQLTISYYPIDSNYIFTNFDFVGVYCPTTYFASGGNVAKGSDIKKLKLTQPNGGDVFIAGDSTLITWEGIPETDTVKLEYSSDGGITWTTITEKVTGLTYLWRDIPNTPGNKCIIRVRNLAEFKFTHWLPMDTIFNTSKYDTVNSIDWSPDGSKIASGTFQGKLTIWDAQSYTLNSNFIVRDLFHIKTVDILCVKWSPDGSQIAIGLFAKDGPAVQVYDALTFDRWCYFYHVSTNSYELRTYSVSWCPDGVKLAYGGINMFDSLWMKDSRIRICDTYKARLIRFLAGHDTTITSIDWNPDGKRIASGSMDNNVRIWDSTGAYIFILTGHSKDVNSVHWNPEGTKIASGSSDKTIKIWDALAGNLINTLTGHDSTITTVQWSPDGKQIASSSLDKTIKIWDALTGNLLSTLTAQAKGSNMNGITCVKWCPDTSRPLLASSQDTTIIIWQRFDTIIQTAISDSAFTIISPDIFSITDVDFHQCLVGRAKDSIINEYISNLDTINCKIDSIYFDGEDRDQFRVITALPFTIQPDSSLSIEFAFTPTSPGEKKVIIRIKSQGKILTRIIKGEGVQPRLELVSKLIDFGIVPINLIKDTTVNVVIKNIGSASFEVKNTIQLGPNTVPFSINDGGGSFSLAPGSSRAMELSFSPESMKRVSGNIGFEYEGVGSPAIVQLFGEGTEAVDISAVLEVPNLEGRAGDTIEIPIYLKNSEKILQSHITGFKTDLSFNASLLVPVDEPNGSVLQGTRTISYNIPKHTMISDELARYKFIVCLGNDTITPLILTNCETTGTQIKLDKTDGQFTLLGICKEGGSRLVNTDGALSLTCKPNPARDKVQFEIGTIEEGQTELYLSDILGNKIIRIFETPFKGRYLIEYDLSNLNSGVYAYTLQTPSSRVSKMFEVLK